ncbi:MAG: zinc-binding dehydrogenase, partial [Pseudomonadota bacterium]|nr:zinc-binding dehydrogenase [Pseudomonadota bacterium]
SSICRALEDRIWPLIADGSISPVTCATFPFAEAADAHRLMESSRHIGKIILTAHGGPETAHRPQSPAPAHQGGSA